MGRRARSDHTGSWHHVMNRGIARRTMFENRRDMRFFLACLARAVRSGSIEVHAYCVLTTHYHLLVRSPCGELSKAMRSVQLAYSRWFNRSRKRDGPLPRSRFTSKLVETLEYRIAVLSYVDRNPVEAGLCDRPEQYRHGSAFHYYRSEGPPWLTRSWVESHLSNAAGEAAFGPALYDWFFGRAESRVLSEVVARRLACGTQRDPVVEIGALPPEEVLDWMKSKARLADGSKPYLPMCEPDQVRSAVARVKGTGGIELAKTRAGCAWELLRVGITYEFCGITQSELAQRENRSVPVIGRRLRMHRRVLASDDAYGEAVARVVWELVGVWRAVA